MKRLLARLSILLALLAVAAGLAWYFKPRSVPPRFRTAQVARGDLVASISATGTIEPEEVIDVGAQVAGKIENLGTDPSDSSKTIDYGSIVHEGTVLAQIDDALFRTQADQARASLRRAEAELGQLRARLNQRDRELKRIRDLSLRSATTEAERDIAEAEFEVAQSALQVGEAATLQAQSSLEQAETNLGYTTIRSPVEGVIIDRRVNVGQTVVASLNAPSLFLIAKDLRRLEVWVAVNEADVGQIRPGQSVSFTVDAFPDEVFAGQVAQIRLNATMTQNVVTYTVVVSTQNENARLLPYLTANVQFETARRTGVLSVPTAALRFRPRPELVATPSGGAPAQREGTANPPGPAPATEFATRKPNGSRHGTLWIYRSEVLEPIEVELGIADQSSTEINTDRLKPGDEIVLGEIDASAPAETATNPFAPPAFRGSRRPPTQ